MEYPEAFLIVASDFNQAYLKSVLPRYHQHVFCPTRGPNTLDYCYTTIKDVYRSICRLHFDLGTPVPTVTAADIRSAFWRENPWKATGPDGVQSRALRPCTDQLAGVLAGIFDLSLLQCKVPTCSKKTTINGKAKEMVIDFRKWSGGHAPICINGVEVEVLENCKFLGGNITNNLSWSIHVDATVKK
eukprot:g44948.t1